MYQKPKKRRVKKAVKKTKMAINKAAKSVANTTRVKTNQAKGKLLLATGSAQGKRTSRKLARKRTIKATKGQLIGESPKLRKRYYNAQVKGATGKQILKNAKKSGYKGRVKTRLSTPEMPLSIPYHERRRRRKYR